MRRCAIVFLLLLGLCGFGASTGSSKDKNKPLTIEYHGQSFFILTTGSGKRIAFDPHFIEVYYRNLELRPPVDVICISHNHNDHVQVGIFKDFKKAKILRGLENKGPKANWAEVNEEIDGIKIKTVPTYHDDEPIKGSLRGKNAIFIIEVDGWRIAHLGDLGHQLLPFQLKKIGQLDVVMVPVGGIYTLNGAEAHKVVEQLKPKEYVFPMHYGTKIFEDILSADEFLELREGLMQKDKNKVVRLSDSEADPTKRENIITLNRDGTRPRPLTVQLHYWPREEKKQEKKKDKDKAK